MRLEALLSAPAIPPETLSERPPPRSRPRPVGVHPGSPVLGGRPAGRVRPLAARRARPSRTERPAAALSFPAIVGPANAPTASASPVAIAARSTVIRRDLIHRSPPLPTRRARAARPASTLRSRRRAASRLFGRDVRRKRVELERISTAPAPAAAVRGAQRVILAEAQEDRDHHLANAIALLGRGLRAPARAAIRAPARGRPRRAGRALPGTRRSPPALRAAARRPTGRGARPGRRRSTGETARRRTRRPPGRPWKALTAGIPRSRTPPLVAGRRRRRPPSTIRPSCSAIACSSTGASILHGSHQSAQKSTTEAWSAR